jgi:hypothetical protein
MKVSHRFRLTLIQVLLLIALAGAVLVLFLPRWLDPGLSLQGPTERADDRAEVIETEE